MTMIAISRHSSTWVIKMKSLSSGESVNIVQKKVGLTFLLSSFVFVGITFTSEGRREGRREVLLNEEARVAASY